MEVAERYNELLNGDTELSLLLKDVEVLGHVACDDGEGPTVQIQTSTPLGMETQDLINQAIEPVYASYNVPHQSTHSQYQQWRSNLAEQEAYCDDHAYDVDTDIPVIRNWNDVRALDEAEALALISQNMQGWSEPE